MAKTDAIATTTDTAIQGTDKTTFNEFVSGANGFSLVETVVFGDQSINKLPLYVGLLEGPSDPVEVGEEIINSKTGEVKRNSMPTWVFKPIVKTGGKLGVVENVTHVVPCNYMVDAACRRIWGKLERDKSVRAIVAVQFIGSEAIKGGSRRLNRYRVSEKYIGINEQIA